MQYMKLWNKDFLEFSNYQNRILNMYSSVLSELIYVDSKYFSVVWFITSDLWIKCIMYTLYVTQYRSPEFNLVS